MLHVIALASFLETKYNAVKLRSLFWENTMGKGNNSQRKEVKKKKAKKDKPKPTSR